MIVIQKLFTTIIRCGNNISIFQHWLDLQKRVCQQIKGISPVTLYLGVKYYAADPCKLAEEITRYQFFLQVKSDILLGRLPVPKDLSVDLAALALQCKSFRSKSQ